MGQIVLRNETYCHTNAQFLVFKNEFWRRIEWKAFVNAHVLLKIQCKCSFLDETLMCPTPLWWVENHI